VRLRVDDLLLLRERAENRQMPTATYVSLLIRSHLRRLAPLPTQELMALKRSIAEVGALGRNLNVIAHALNRGELADGPTKADLLAVLRALSGLRDHTKAVIRANLESWELGHALATVRSTGRAATSGRGQLWAGWAGAASSAVSNGSNPSAFTFSSGSGAVDESTVTKFVLAALQSIEGSDNRRRGPTMPLTSRRSFISTATGIAAAVTAGPGRASDSSLHSNAQAAGPHLDLVMLDAVELSRSIKAKRASCVEVMAAYLDQIERVNPKVNAVVSLQPREGLMKQAAERDRQLAAGQYLGVMHGFPHAVKDLAATKGIRTSYGSPLLDGVPDHDAILVERLRNNGAILIGKTNAPEFGLGSQTYNPVFGTTLNAYDQTKAAGGSSGGAAVALALRMVPVADGSDMMGSLRNPAGFNNVVGFRPSYGRVPGAGAELFLGQLSTGGPMGRSVSDVAMLLSILAGPDPRAPLSIEQEPHIFAANLLRDLKGTRVGWLGDLGGHLQFEPGITELCHDALRALETTGCKVCEASLSFPPEKMWETWVTLRQWLTAGDLQKLYANSANRDRMKPEAIWEVEGGTKLSAADVYGASAARSDFYRAISTVFENFDFLVLPSAQVFPFDAATHWPKTINGVSMDTYHRWMEVVVPGSLLGHPVVSVPVGFNAGGLPMGMQIIGRHNADLAVLQIAFAYEQATQWTRKTLPKLLKTP
jgi:amidase